MKRCLVHTSPPCLVVHALDAWVSYVQVEHALRYGCAQANRLADMRKRGMLHVCLVAWIDKTRVLEGKEVQVA